MFNIEYDILDELNIGNGVKLRLVQNIHTKNKSIQSWSSLSNQWNIMYRYNVVNAWISWKRTADSVNSRKKKKVRKKG